MSRYHERAELTDKSQKQELAAFGAEMGLNVTVSATRRGTLTSLLVEKDGITYRITGWDGGYLSVECDD